jgi:hypothetical protein
MRSVRTFLLRITAGGAFAIALAVVIGGMYYHS